MKHNNFELMEILASHLTGERNEFDAEISLPVIHGNICLGSNFLRARTDIYRYRAILQIEVMQPEQVHIILDNFQATETAKSEKIRKLGLIAATGLFSVSVLTENDYDSYELFLSRSSEKLHGRSEESVDDLTGVSHDKASVPGLFAVGCIRAMQKIISGF